MEKVQIEQVNYEEFLRDVKDMIKEALAPLLAANEENNPLLTRKQAAMILGVKEQTIDNYRRQGKLNSVLVGGNVRIRKTDIDNLI